MKLHHHPQYETRPCHGHWDVYDTLVDLERGPKWAHARKEARELCHSCPLSLQSQCLKEALEAGDQWAHAVTGKKPPRRCDTPDCDKPHVARGYCTYHYSTWQAAQQTTPCAIDGCTTPKRTAGLCHVHYLRGLRAARRVA